MGMLREDKRWAFLDEDSDLDDEAHDARQAAGELKAKANAWYDEAAKMQEGTAQSEKLREAVAMYSRADALLNQISGGRSIKSVDRESLLQCRLNGACLSLKLGDEASTEKFLAAASELDSENPHIALFKARLATIRCKLESAEKWTQRAKSRAKQRGEEHLLKKASDFLEPRSHETKSPQKVLSQNAPSPGRWVQEGVALIKQRRPAEAEDRLKRAIAFLDQEAHGGPIEKLAARAPRALAFNALEALSDVHASLGRWSDAVSCGQRALDLLKETHFEMPFSNPEVYRREGHLCFSIGHATLAAGGDATPAWRQAIKALEKHGDDLSTAGQALLKLGLHHLSLHSPEPGKCDDMDAIEEAVMCLENAADRFGRARSRLAADEDLSPAIAEKRHADLVRYELEAQANLAKLLYDCCETSDAESVLDSSAALLDLVPDIADMPQELATCWADLLGKWGVTANKLRRLSDTERSILIQIRLLRNSGSRDAEMQALKALAVLRWQQRNQVGVDEALASLEDIAPEEDRESAVAEVRRRLALVGPADDQALVGPADDSISRAVADQVAPKEEGFSSHARRRPICLSAILIGALAVIAGLIVPFGLATHSLQ